VNRLRSWQLIAICVLTWGTTWYAITFQIGHTSPEFGVALRFGLAGCVVLMWRAAAGDSLRLGARDHARLALQGGFMYGLSYLCVYHAEKHVVSGLVAVGYSASPLVSGLGARWLFGTPVTSRFLWGGAIGLVGVALIFAPEFSKAAAQVNQSSILWGALFTVASVLLSSVGSLTASRNRQHGMPFWPSLGWGMLYGALVAGVVALVMGQTFVLPTVPSWWLSLVYLALAGSVMTFACFLTLQERIGPGPSGSIGVMTPLLALLVSMLLESYQASLYTLFGAALAVLGNVLVLRPKRNTPGVPATAHATER
jgi:drug/metabolite transporter (DMT)-like permease